MSDVRSKNIYELLGNDPELDPNREPEAPLEVGLKPAHRTGKRDVASKPPGSDPTLSRGGPRYAGNDLALRQGVANSRANRSRPVDETARTGGPPGHMRNRDTRGNAIRHDRQPRNDRTITEKQVEQGWGALDGEAARADETVGEIIAQKDRKEATTEAQEGEQEEEKEPEEKVKSYAEYVAELEQSKREGGLGVKEARKPNEGSKVDKKWAAAKELKRNEDEAAYIKGQEEKARREKQRKEKNILDVDMRYVEAPRRGDFGGRGRGRGGDRGGRGRGGDRGDRGDRGGRGEFRGRGGPAPQGGPTVDEKNFPSLGGK